MSAARVRSLSGPAARIPSIMAPSAPRPRGGASTTLKQRAQRAARAGAPPSAGASGVEEATAAAAAVLPPLDAGAAIVEEAAAAEDAEAAAAVGEEEEEEELVWYFAFGSNMSPTVLEERRKVAPRASRVAYVPGFRLAFDVRGFPYREPAFASVQPITDSAADAAAADSAAAGAANGASNGSSGSSVSVVSNGNGNGASSSSSGGVAAAAAGVEAPCCVHGVAFQVTRADWEQICVTENAAPDGSGSYRVVPVECVAYGAEGEAGGSRGGDGDGGERVSALTLQATERARVPDGVSALPSRRYLDLLIQGAAHHGLAPSYQAYLAALPAYAPPSSLRYQAGRLLFGAVSKLLLGPLLLAMAALAVLRGRDRQLMFPTVMRIRPIRAYVVAAMGVTWWLHNAVLRHLFGCGLSTTGPREAAAAAPSGW